MFRAGKWKIEKNKTKVDFSLQFQATEVPQTGWDKLYVSLIPLETGKTTAKTGKVSVHNGCCQWIDPIYETTRLVQDSKTGKYDEKLYTLVVSTGSSRFGFLGETTINLADYAGATNPSSVSLPLQSCSASTILHVIIQRLTARTGYRDFEQHRELMEKGHHLMATEANTDDDLDESALFSEGTTNGRCSEENSFTNSTVHFSSDSREVASHRAEANGNYRGYIAADALSNSSSGSSYTAKQELSDVHEIGRNNGIHQDAVSFLSSLSQNAKPPKLGNNTAHSMAHTRQQERSNNDWTDGWNSNHYRENDKANIYEENERLKANLQASESTIEELQKEVSTLDRQAAGLAREMEMLKKQLAKEIKQGQEFSREIYSIKAERDNMKSEFEQLKASGQGSEKQKAADKAQHEIDDARCILEELKQELGYEKQVNINLNLQLQKTQESNSELLLAIQDLDELLEQKNKEIEELSDRRCDDSVLGEDNQARSFQDVKMEWLQKLSSSEQKIREIKDKIVVNDTGGSLEFLQDDMEILETAFQEAKQENITLICKLNSEIDSKNKRIADLEYGMQNSPRKVPLVNNIANNVEVARTWNTGNSTFHLDEGERLNYNQPSKRNTLCDLRLMEDKILQLDKIRLELENRNHNLEEEVRIYRHEIADLESQLSVVEEEARALTACNQQQETKIESLEVENLELQNCLNASQEAGKLAREQIGDLMEEMSLLSGKTGSDCGVRKSTDKHISELEDDPADIASALFHLQEHNGQLLKRISELDMQLKHEKEKNETQQRAKEVADASRKTERKFDSTLELKQKIHELSREAEDYKRARDFLVKEIEQIEYEYEALKEEHEKCASGKLEKQLQDELQNLQDEHATSLSTISILESKVENLQQEIDKQATKFAEDMDAMSVSKMEQEQRAKRAEEALRKTRWNNASTAERLQEEFKRLSLQMSSTFDANEKLATQALAEASELRVQKATLQESLKKAGDEIISIKEECKVNVQELMTQLELSKKQGEALSSKLQNSLDELEKQKKSETNFISRNEELSLKLTMLKREVQTVLDEKNDLTQRVEECEHLKTELENAKIALDGCRTEKTELDAALQQLIQDKVKLDEELSMLKEKLRNSEAELNELKCCRDDQDIRVAFLMSKLDEQAAQISFDSENAHELTQLRSQHTELKHRLSEKELETEDLRKQIFSLRGELQQKADALAVAERKLKDKEEKLKLHAAGSPVKPVSKINNKTGPLSRNVKEVADLRDKVKLLEGEVKSKTIALEASRQEFNAKEKNLQIKIEQLEMISEHLRQEYMSSSIEQLQDELKSLEKKNLSLMQHEKELLSKLVSQEILEKEVKHLQEVNEQLESMNSSLKEPAKGGNAKDRVLALETELADALEANNIYKKQLQSALVNVFTKQQNEQAAALQNFRDMNELMNDMVALKTKNSMMEDELKEMHDRYSQISLKFAEVEGERQQLVITIRNLRNAKKN